VQGCDSINQRRIELQRKIASGSFGTATTGSNGDIIDVITVTIDHFLKKQGMTPKKDLSQYKSQTRGGVKKTMSLLSRSQEYSCEGCSCPKPNRGVGGKGTRSTCAIGVYAVKRL
jgi:hypothetical protein